MLNRMRSYLLFALISILCIPPDGRADGEDGDKPERRTYRQRVETAPGKTLYVDLQNADMVIAAGEGSEIAIEAAVDVSGGNAEMVEEFLSKTELVLEAHGEGFRAALKNPEYERSGQQNGGSSVGFLRRIFFSEELEETQMSISTHLRVSVPARQSLDIANKFGDISVTGVNGILFIDNRSGEVSVKAAQGSLQL